ncbi:transmembrane protein [Arabidopsis thaliana]|uniref:Transmembrane protein n=2 Tax=Arabidopsis thaliana TaxID=3702 RepID=Q9FI09_ARATH|nr:uncharacterized protein AT5G53670 [Arabidopsis thaliana]ABE65581.1 hypothetical protein At5g53670 [Arabidopsis thaliana]AED96393.1 transmembrane protein [Arabidopsis thaliana]BAB09539.1 unnamed protein product [Arabidopsis thaliana]|eukprot:NP_200178.1 transmembrane protein [Arabidopsis thaliana]
MLNVSVGYKVYLTTYLTLSFSLFSVLGYTSSLSNVDSIPMLSGSNFSEWKEHLLLVLALMDLDLSLMTERPSSPKELKHWDRSNRVSIMIMKIRIPQGFRGVVPDDVTTAKDFLASLENFFAKNEEAERSRVQAESSSMSYIENENVRELIMRMKTLGAKRKRLGINNIFSNDMMLAHCAVKMLPLQYISLKNVYSCLEGKFVNENGRWHTGEIWSTKELISRCDMEEETLRTEIADEARKREQ